MVRLADYLYRFTGDAVYASYIEKNLYSGFLAQQNKHTGMPTYFLPMKSGSRMSRWFLKFTVKANIPETFTLSFRVPDWTKHRSVVILNGEEWKDIPVHNGCLDIEREWADDVISLYFTASLTASTLPDMPGNAAFMEGPVVLAGLCDKDCHITLDNDRPESALTYVTEHTYDTFPWQQSTYRTINRAEHITLTPLYDITDEPYTIYFSTKHKETPAAFLKSKDR